MKTIYISDLDGTLLQPNAELSKKTITILNDLISDGMLFTIATARTIASARIILSDVDLTLPIILMNGVCIYDLKENRYIHIETLQETARKKIISLINDNNLSGFAYAIKDDVLSTYYEHLNTKALLDFYEERVTKYKKPFQQIDNFSLLEQEPLIYFCLMGSKDNLEGILPFLDKISEVNYVFYKDNYTTDTWYLEIFSKYASKYHAIQYLRNMLKPDSVVCFGDNRNDIPLFTASDYKCAVANAVPELKEKADEIIGSNTNNGVVSWLKYNKILASRGL